MLRFILDVLILRRFINSRPAMRVVSVVFIMLLILGVIYAAVIFNVVETRMDTPHVHAHSTH